jgi:hypothetical protein
VDLPRDTEICNLDFPVCVKQDIVQLNVSVHDQLRVVQISKTLYQLFEEVFGDFFCQLPSLPYIS